MSAKKWRDGGEAQNRVPENGHLKLYGYPKEVVGEPCINRLCTGKTIFGNAYCEKCRKALSRYEAWAERKENHIIVGVFLFLVVFLGVTAFIAWWGTR